jgi:Tol biopolymer transport system component
MFVRFALVLSLAASPALAQQTRLVDENIGGGTPLYGALWPSLSTDGQLVVFDSTGESLAAGDANGVGDVFLRDMLTGVTEIVSFSTSGAQGDGGSRYGRMSPSGRFVTFISTAQNFVTPSEIDSHEDVFLRDRTAGTTTKISVSPSGGASDGVSYLPDLSDDGNRVVFQSGAENLVAVDGNGVFDVFVRDLAQGTTLLLSRSTGGGGGNKDSYQPSISNDGRFVAFTSDANDLVAGDTNNRADVFLYDLQTATLERISLGPNGIEGDGHSREASISGDGGVVIFASSATNLVAGDTNAWQDIFERDTALNTTALLSKSQGGALPNYSSFSSALSVDGRYATFTTGATNITSPPTQQPVGMVRVDRASGAVVPVALSGCNVPLTMMTSPAISPDGSIVAFASRSALVVPDDVNDRYDVFVHDPDAPASPPPCTFCVIASTSNGCLPSISASGTPSASASTGFDLTIHSVEGNKNALFVHGPSSITTPWGIGGPSYLCVFNLGRFGHQNSGGAPGQCDGVLNVDWNATNAWWAQAGDVVVAQAWFRDPGSAKTTHLSNAISFIAGP